MIATQRRLLEAQPDSGPPEKLKPRPWLIAVPALAFFGVATALMLGEVEPFINWYYVSAWYPTILVLDAVQATISGRYYIVSRPRFAVSLLGWSAVLWFFFEVVNIRVANWYYVFLPPDRPLRWFGTTISFMTVFPAIFLAERLLAERNKFEKVRWPTFDVSRRLLIGVFIAGIVFAGLSLAWPWLFFPMIWGALTLLLEPLNYWRDPGRSLIGDLSTGRPGRLLRFLAGGLMIGFLWELYNIESRSKWIYTVPGFENFKLFEMPLLGFLGFPVFALDCFVVYQSLVMARVAVAENVGTAGALKVKPRRAMVAAAAAAVFSLAALFGMDRWNTDSVRPQLEGLWAVESSALERLEMTRYRDVFALARAEPQAVADVTESSLADAEEWVAAARLSTLRGIGTANAQLLWQVGVESVADLAASDPSRLGERLRGLAQRPRAATPLKVRVWVRAARRATGDGGSALSAR
jgi:hypothetical protein